MGKLFTVTDVKELRRIGDTGNVEVVYQYQAKSAGGIVFTETLKEVDTTPEKVQEILGKKAERLDRTKAL
ncbi:MAG: hypothetical protein PHQ43_11650 [Dehalococcoidales bacterium]|nr:hypothetical protein [Dehalococcoidales bacterium]